MKHKKEVDELFRKFDLIRRNPALRERMELKMWIIMLGVHRDIKRRIDF